jgi:hypothetical protein
VGWVMFEQGCSRTAAFESDAMTRAFGFCISICCFDEWIDELLDGQE